MSGVSTRDGSWNDPSSNHSFYYRFWSPPTPRTLLVIVHGFGEHGGRYQPIAQVLAEQGLCVAAPDLLGHGRSGGRRGDIGSIAQCVEDLQAITTQVFLPASGQGQYALFGHSFGGLVAIQWLLKRPTHLRSAVIQSPLLEVGFPLPRWKTLAARFLARYCPTCSLPMHLDVEALSHDPMVVQSYRTDPLVHNMMSARTYASILSARDDAFARTQTIDVPALLLLGMGDRIISVEAAQRWFARLQCEKQIVTFPDAYHELHHETVRERVLRLISEWTLEHLR